MCVFILINKRDITVIKKNIYNKETAGILHSRHKNQRGDSLPPSPFPFKIGVIIAATFR